MAEEANKELIWYVGDSYTKEVTITDKETGGAIDLTGYTIRMHVDTLQAPTDVATELFVLDGTITNAVEGKFTVNPTSDQNDIGRATYYYRVKLTIASDVRTVNVNKYKII